MITSTVIRACHFTVTSIIFTTVAQCKTVCLIGAEEFVSVGFYQGNKGLVPGVQ